MTNSRAIALGVTFPVWGVVILLLITVGLVSLVVSWAADKIVLVAAWSIAVLAEFLGLDKFDRTT